jgi:ubiquinone/menaquinone biosynthesis C-methylase UbiE
MFSAVDAYDRYVGRYSPKLARKLIAVSGIGAGSTALDVGCGTGALTAELVTVLGALSVSAADPSEAFAEACRQRLPDVDVRIAPAEALPFNDQAFGASFAQLVVPFMKDAVAGVTEMRRVTRRGGPITAAVWDYADGMTLIRTFWDAAISVVADAARARDETNMRWGTPAELADLWTRVGLTNVQTSAAVVGAEYESFEDLWWPLERGVGPAGAYVVSLGDDDRAALKDKLRNLLGVSDTPFELTARAWVVVGRTP